jgi:tetratricopeptide (TPR) repeat protein
MTGDRKEAARVVVFLVVAFWAAAALAQGEFDQATRLGMRGDYDGALREYETFFETHPDHELAPLAALAAGNLLYETREDFAGAIGQYDRVVRDYVSSPWASEAARRKGEAARAMEDWAGAGEAFSQALDLASRPGSRPSPAWINEVTTAAGEAFFQAGDRDRVLAVYQKVLDTDPPAEVAGTALYRMAETYEQLGKEELAARMYAEILRTYPGTTRQFVDGAMSKRDLIDRHTTFDWKPYDLDVEVTNLIRQRDFAGAFEKCKEEKAGCGNPRLLECIEYREIGLEATVSGDYETAAERMEHYLQSYPRAQLGTAAENNLLQWAQIVETKHQVEENPGDPDAGSMYGYLLLRAGSFPAAIAQLEKTRNSNPRHARTLQFLGTAYGAAGRTEDATRAFEAFLEIEPDNTAALNQVGYAYLGSGLFDKAVTCFRRYVELSPNEANAHDSLAEGLYRSGRLEEAAGEYERAVALDSSFANSYFFLGEIYRELKQNDKAIQAYERFLELAPTGDQADQTRAALETLRNP